MDNGKLRELVSGFSYVRVIPDEAFYPLEINNPIAWAKYNIVLPLETMTEEDWVAFWEANEERLKSFKTEGGFYNTLNLVLLGIPDAAQMVYHANGQRGQEAWNNPSVETIANFFTMGLVGQFETAINTPTSDPNYWRALRNILLTEAGAIGVYNSIAAGGSLPTTTEELIEWGNRMGAPQGNVPQGTFDEAFSTGYTGNADYYHSIEENVSATSSDYSFSNGYFGENSPHGNNHTRNIAAPDNLAAAEDFFDSISEGGVITQKTSNMEVVKMADGTVISMRKVSHSDGTPVIDINTDKSTNTSGVKTPKIHFVKEGD